ncbi:MAG: hypothetical protein ACOC2O_02305, partial [Bacillota bacterium]
MKINKKVIFAGLAFLLVFSLSLGNVYAEELLYEQNWDDYEEGDVLSEDWEVGNRDELKELDAEPFIAEIHDEKALEVQSHPDLDSTTRVTREFDFDKGALEVDFHQPADDDEKNDNVYVDIRTPDGRLFGLFITGSGNVRYRDDGDQSDNVMNLSPGEWHTVRLEWDNDNKKYNAYVKQDGELEPIVEAADFNSGLDDTTPSMIAFEVSNRDVVKAGNYKNIKVYSMEDLEITDDEIYTQNWEDYEVGDVLSEDWDVGDRDQLKELESEPAITEIDDEKALEVKSHPDLGSTTRVTREFDFASGALEVDFRQAPDDDDKNDNVYVDIRTPDGRLFGLFITGSGNVRYRDDGDQSDNTMNLTPGEWHTVYLEWDNESQTYDAYAEKLETMVPIVEGAKFNSGLDDTTPSMIAFEVSDRDVVKAGYYK